MYHFFFTQLFPFQDLFFLSFHRLICLICCIFGSPPTHPRTPFSLSTHSPIPSFLAHPLLHSTHSPPCSSLLSYKSVFSDRIVQGSRLYYQPSPFCQSLRQSIVSLFFGFFFFFFPTRLPPPIGLLIQTYLIRALYLLSLLVCYIYTSFITCSKCKEMLDRAYLFSLRVRPCISCISYL